MAKARWLMRDLNSMLESNDIEWLIQAVEQQQKEIEALEMKNIYFVEGNCKCKETLCECVEAIRKNLEYAQFKDEQILFSAYNNAKQLLGEEE